MVSFGREKKIEYDVITEGSKGSYLRWIAT